MSLPKVLHTRSNKALKGKKYNICRRSLLSINWIWIIFFTHKISQSLTVKGRNLSVSPEKKNWVDPSVIHSGTGLHDVALNVLD